MYKIEEPERFPLVTVIVPMFNAREYIVECLDSIRKQTYTNLEVLLINDGSTDNTESVCKEYLKDNRFSLINIQNSGVSHSRNIGINKAHGKYLFFVDADDYLDENYIDKMVSYEHDCKLVLCGFCRVSGKQAVNYILEDKKWTREEVVFHCFCSNLMGGSCWNKRFSAETIKTGGIRFHPDIAIGEDSVFLAEYISCIDTDYGYIANALYYYRKNPDSAMQNVYHKRGSVDEKASCLTALEKINEVMCSETTIIKNCVAYRNIRTCIWLLFQMSMCREYNSDYGKMIKALIELHYKAYRQVKAGSKLEHMVTAWIYYFGPKMVYRISTNVQRIFPELFKKYLN